MVKKAKKKVSEESKMQAFVATFLSIIGFIIAIILWKDDKYTMHYAAQSLVIFILGVIFVVPRTILGWIPVMGEIIEFALGLILFIVWLMSWINALSCEKKTIPVVSDIAKNLKF